MDKNNSVEVKQKDTNTTAAKVVNIIAIVLSVLLIPILAINCVLIIQGMVNEDEVPSLGKTIPLIVLTESMDPEIKSGDLIISKKAKASEVKVGDVITFFDPEGNGSSVVTHRVIKIETDSETGVITGFRTQGDNNDIEDRLSVPPENLIGIWTGTRIGLLGHVVLFTQSTLGIILCIFLPIGAFVLYEVLRRRKHDKEKQSDIDKLKAELEAMKAQNAQQGQNGGQNQSSQQGQNGGQNQSSQQGQNGGQNQSSQQGQNGGQNQSSQQGQNGGQNQNAQPKQNN